MCVCSLGFQFYYNNPTALIGGWPSPVTTPSDYQLCHMFLYGGINGTVFFFSAKSLAFATFSTKKNRVSEWKYSFFFGWCFFFFFGNWNLCEWMDSKLSLKKKRFKTQKSERKKKCFNKTKFPDTDKVNGAQTSPGKKNTRPLVVFISRNLGLVRIPPPVSRFWGLIFDFH